MRSLLRGRTGVLCLIAISHLCLCPLGCSGESGSGEPLTDAGAPPDASPDRPDAIAAIQLKLAAELAPEGAAGQPLAEPVLVEVLDGEGEPVSGAGLMVSVVRGGGAVDPAELRTGEDGRASFTWTLGRPPVLNAVSVVSGEVSLAMELRATLAAPLAPEPFGDVNGYLAAQGIDGSTEDLAFSPDGRLVMGVPGGIIYLDAGGEISAAALSGDPLEGPLGMAYDAGGKLWVADLGGKALRKVSPEGVVTTVITGDGQQELQGPNYVAVGPRGRIFLSDPCLGEVIMVEPSTGEVIGLLSFDLGTQGGPNGFAFAPGREKLYLATENTALLCRQGGIPPNAPLAGLFVVEVDEEGFGQIEPVATEMGLFGDGMAFDAEGNLYVIFDRESGGRLTESTVWVLPAGGGELVPFLSVQDRVLANLAFGQGDFGEGTLYIALLAVPPFTAAEARGAERFEVNIPGLPLLP